MREVRRALLNKEILVNGKAARPGARALGGEAIDLSRFTPRAEAKVSANAKLAASIEKIFEDEMLLVLNKPSGVPTQPIHPPRDDDFALRRICVCTRG